ncbi:hypothetical protein HPB47_018101 [Ixodes persulcatus]|uniref:Uncharacterized protein n=1 Tax=Ixodes persulcatus TaxID=34615 RepID=A0AC60QLM7_IXOPE|nr:hypothetical protein HPB47_018101 [Ixodes persulcatus]
MDGGACASPLASRRRFAITDDIVLLHEVEALNPLRNATQCTAVTDNLKAATGRSFTVRSVRERCDLLLGLFRREERSNLRESGTEEQYTVKEQLLQKISDLTHEFGYMPKVLPRSSSAVASAGTATGQVSIQRTPPLPPPRAGSGALDIPAAPPASVCPAQCQQGDIFCIEMGDLIFHLCNYGVISNFVYSTSGHLFQLLVLTAPLPSLQKISPKSYLNYCVLLTSVQFTSTKSICCCNFTTFCISWCNIIIVIVFFNYH